MCYGGASETNSSSFIVINPKHHMGNQPQHQRVVADPEVKETAVPLLLEEDDEEEDVVREPNEGKQAIPAAIPLPLVFDMKTLCPNPWIGENSVCAWTAALDPLALTKCDTQLFALPCGCSSARHVGGILGFRLQWFAPKLRRGDKTHRLTVFTAGANTAGIVLPQRELMWRCRLGAVEESWCGLTLKTVNTILDQDVVVGSCLDAKTSTWPVTWYAIYNVNWLPFVTEWTSPTTKLMLHDFSFTGPRALEMKAKQETIALIQQTLEATSSVPPPDRQAVPETVLLPKLNPADLDSLVVPPTAHVIICKE